MIVDRNSLHSYIEADYNRQEMKYPIIARFTWGEHHRTRRYLSVLRHLEYYKNKSNKKLTWILFCYYWLQHRRLSLKYGIFIAPNTCGPGLLLPHPGFVFVSSIANVGKNCTILPNVLFGNSHPVKGLTINVGDNCYFGTGSTILGNCCIGNNVTVAAGSVVTKDIPDNCIVGGVPAKIIKYKEM